MPYNSIFRTGLFEGETHIVTGGGSGIGRCIAHELAALGAHVVLVGRKVEKLETVAAEIVEDAAGAGGSADFWDGDIRDEDRVTGIVREVVEKHGPIHGLVNNAGGQFPAPIAWTSKKGFEAVVKTNLVGGFLFAREVYKQSMEAHGGAVVNIVADFWRGMPMMAHTGAARAGMVNFTQSASVEWAPAGVRVNAVAPGYIASSGMDTYGDEVKPFLLTMPKTIPAKRYGTEAEVSAAVCFLLSEGAAFITGTTLRVDGGGPLNSAVWPTPDHDKGEPFEGFHRGRLPKVLAEVGLGGQGDGEGGS